MSNYGNIMLNRRELSSILVVSSMSDKRECFEKSGPVGLDPRSLIDFDRQMKSVVRSDSSATRVPRVGAAEPSCTFIRMEMLLQNFVSEARAILVGAPT